MIKDLNKTLKIVSENDDMVPFLNSLKAIIDKEGKFSQILKKTGFSKEELRDILENNTELYFEDAMSIFKALGLTVEVKS